jgi:hypothetical protein
MSDLKPCPFCGNEPEMIHAVLEEYHSVNPEIICRECGYRIKAKNLAIAVDDSPKENCDFLDRQTIRYWNTRPAEDAKDKEIERLENKLKELKECIIDSRDKYMKLTEHKDFTTATISFGAYNLLNSFIEIINAPDNNVGTMEEK